jgi:uncharacterized protein
LFSFSRSPTGLLIRIAVLALCCGILAVPSSRAQDTGGFPGFLQHLFGFTPKPQPPPNANAPSNIRPRAPRKKEQDYVSPSATRAPGWSGARVEQTLFITVLGDSLAISAAQGLTDAFANRRDVAITTVARDLSGLTRNDYYDWPKAARDLVAGKQKIDVAVVMIGVNDVQPLKDGDTAFDPLSDKWRELYAQRVEALIAPFRDKDIPVLWVGLPSMPDDRFNAQAIALNEIYRERVEKAGGKYIDIWDGFVDQNGQYSAFGPDVDGQNARLRSGASGIYFTKAGSRKLAQFLEMDIRRTIDKGKPQNDIAALPPDIEQEADDINAEIRREMGVEKPLASGLFPSSKPVAGPILSLTAQPTSANASLDGALSANRRDLDRSVRLGQTAEPRHGRADDFTWPAPQ